MRLKQIGARMSGLLLAALLLTGCDTGLYSGTFIFDGSHHFGPDVHLPGDVFMRAGTATFAPGTQVYGSVYVLGGSLILGGDVTGDLIVVDGIVDLGPSARIGGDLRFSDGTLTQAPTTHIQGNTLQGLPLPQATEVPQPWNIVPALLLAIVGGLWANRPARHLHNVAAAVSSYAHVATAIGILALLILPILLVMMAFTIVLLPLVLVLAMLSIGIIAFGLIAQGMLIGTWLADRAKISMGPGWRTFWGVLLLNLLFALPWLGDALLAVAALYLFGAVILTRFGTRLYAPPPRPAGDITSYRRQIPSA